MDQNSNEPDGPVYALGAKLQVEVNDAWVDGNGISDLPKPARLPDSDETITFEIGRDGRQHITGPVNWL